MGLRYANDLVLRMAQALPLLETHRFNDGITNIDEEITQFAQPYYVERLRRFAQYIRNTWARLASVVSVYNQPSRTNNYAESFYRHAHRKLGGSRPELFKFLSKRKF